MTITTFFPFFILKIFFWLTFKSAKVFHNLHKEFSLQMYANYSKARNMKSDVINVSIGNKST